MCLWSEAGLGLRNLSRYFKVLDWGIDVCMGRSCREYRDRWHSYDVKWDLEIRRKIYDVWLVGPQITKQKTLGWTEVKPYQGPWRDTFKGTTVTVSLRSSPKSTYFVVVQVKVSLITVLNFPWYHLIFLVPWHDKFPVRFFSVDIEYSTHLETYTEPVGLGFNRTSSLPLLL